jgi:entericidin B
MKHVLIVAAMLGLMACNTMEGAGEDIEAGGRAVSDTSRETKEEMR